MGKSINLRQRKKIDDQGGNPYCTGVLGVYVSEDQREGIEIFAAF